MVRPTKPDRLNWPGLIRSQLLIRSRPVQKIGRSKWLVRSKPKVTDPVQTESDQTMRSPSLIIVLACYSLDLAKKFLSGETQIFWYPHYVLEWNKVRFMILSFVPNSFSALLLTIFNYVKYLYYFLNYFVFFFYYMSSLIDLSVLQDESTWFCTLFSIFIIIDNYLSLINYIVIISSIIFII